MLHLSQIEKEMAAFSRSTRGVSTCIVVGGVNMSEQRGVLRGGVEIVVATRGASSTTCSSATRR